MLSLAVCLASKRLARRRRSETCSNWAAKASTARVAGLIARLPAGASEIYMHPAVRGGFPFSAPGYLYADELAALTAEETLAALRSSGAALGGFADFLPAA